MKQLLFFGLKEDLIATLELVESKGRLKFITTGNFPECDAKNRIKVYETSADIPKLGEANTDQCSTCDSYLVCEQEASVNLRNLVDDNGEKRVLIDQLLNPDSVSFIPGGIWNEEVILSGRVATVSDSSVSKALMLRFLNAFKRSFTKVRAYYVGPKALSLLKNGKRLAGAAVQSPPEFDLKLPVEE